MNLTDAINQLPSLKTTVEAHGLLAKKSLGQNFLLDSNITDKLISDSLRHQQINDFTDANVFEIGPGPGGLTRSVLRANPKNLTVIEMDDRCISIMEEIKEKAGDRLTIINGDALKTNISELNGDNKHIVSNLPYNISVPLLTSWLENITSYKSLTLMFQKEVAERITAPINCKDYGRLSILAQLQCRVEKLLDLSPENFVPAPKIWSSVLLFRPLPQTLHAEELKKVEHLTALAFSQRRKMIRQSLKSLPNLEDICQKIGIQTTFRPEQITPQQFLLLAKNA